MTYYTNEQRKGYIEGYLKEKAAGTIKSMKQYCVRIGVNDTTFGGWMNHGYGVMQSSYTQEERESILAAL